VAKLIEYDVTDVEESGGGGEVPTPGVYVAEIKIFEQRAQKADGTPAKDIHLAVNVGERFMWLHTYVGLTEAADWKLKELVSALGLKDRGRINPDKEKGKLIRIKVNPDTYEGQPTARVGRLMKALEDDTEPGPVSGAAQTSPAVSGTDTDPDPDEPEETAAEGGDPDFEPSREGDEFGSYDEWSDEDRAEEVADRGVTVPGGRGSARDKHIKALRADDEEAASGGDGGGSGGDDDTAASADEYDDWDDSQLESEISDRELEMPEKKRGSGAAERYRKAMIELLRKDDAENPFEA
jgi:hypothetical protein